MPTPLEYRPPERPTQRPVITLGALVAIVLIVVIRIVTVPTMPLKTPRIAPASLPTTSQSTTAE